MLLHLLHVSLEDVKPVLVLSLGQVSLAKLLLELGKLQLGVVSTGSQGHGGEAGEQEDLHDDCL